MQEAQSGQLALREAIVEQNSHYMHAMANHAMDLSLWLEFAAFQDTAADLLRSCTYVPDQFRVLDEGFC